VKKRLASLFGSRKRGQTPSTKAVSTIPLKDINTEVPQNVSKHLEPQQLLFCCGQSSGKQRDHNEDNIFAMAFGAGGVENSNPIGLFVIADGMGGHQDGEVASAIAARTVGSFILNKLHPLFINPSNNMDESIQDVMRAAINEAQISVTKDAPGSGTTLTAALVLGQQITFGHVGDSRAYLVQPYGHGEAVTRDHSLVKRLEELGQISSEEAAIHPQRNVLYRALGQGDMLEPDVFTNPFPVGGYLVLCSDGLWGVVPENRIYQTIINSGNLQIACLNLVDAANDAGGPDNISVIVIHLTG
jgi:PPM family protein phosphatase